MLFLFSTKKVQIFEPNVSHIIALLEAPVVGLSHIVKMHNKLLNILLFSKQNKYKTKDEQGSLVCFSVKIFKK